MIDAKRKSLLLTLALLAGAAYSQLSSALPVSGGFEGAVFSLQAEQVSDGKYRLTYSANFDGLASPGSSTYLSAIDWNWQSTDVQSVELVSAPGSSPTDWSIYTAGSNPGNSKGCNRRLALASVCASLGGAGLDLSEVAGELSWVFDVDFKGDVDIKTLIGNTVRAGLFSTGDSGYAGKVLSCQTGVESSCSPMSLSTPSRVSVPAPGVLGLMGIGLAGLIFSRRRVGRQS